MPPDSGKHSPGRRGHRPDVKHYWSKYITLEKYLKVNITQINTDVFKVLSEVMDVHGDKNLFHSHFFKVLTGKEKNSAGEVRIVRNKSLNFFFKFGPNHLPQKCNSQLK